MNYLKRNAVLVLLLSMISSAGLLAQTYDDPKIQEKAAKIHAAALSLDTHGDVPTYMVSRPGFNIGEEHDVAKTRSQIDFPRMKKGGLDAMFFAVYLGQGERTAAGNAEAKERALELFQLIHQSVEDNPSMAGLATSPEDAHQLKEKGKTAVFIGIENGWVIGRDLALLKKYYDLGARYMTLSHTTNNDICDSSTDPNGPEHDGLSEFGVQVVEEMNKLGMMVDISHTSDKTFYDCIEHSKAPIIASHSSARALYDHPRNMNDDMIKALAKKGGVIQMNMLSSYLKDSDPARVAAMKELREKFPRNKELTDTEREARMKELESINKRFPEQLATLQMVVDHIDHIVKLVGVDYVGIGADLDGGGGVIGMYDVSEMGNVTYELVKRGYSEEDIKKIWSGNLFRVMKEVEKVAGSPVS